MKFEKVQVECYEGYKAAERPAAFTHAGVRHEVRRVVDRWYEGGLDPARPAIHYFKVETKNGAILLLRYLSLFDAWSVLVPDDRT